MLSTYRVLDLADEKGTVCGEIFARLGADVIKVQNPRQVEEETDVTCAAEKRLFRLAYDAGKRSITLNLEAEEGKQLFGRLVESSDFVIESFEPGYMDSLGIGYEALRQINPRLILTSITPFGANGPFANYKASDIVTTAMGGLLYMSGDPDRAPVRYSFDQSYIQAGALAIAGTLIAHYQQHQTGKGQHVDVSIQECNIFCTFLLTHLWAANHEHLSRQGMRGYRGLINPRYVWPCKDGYIAWRLYGGGLGSKTATMVDWMASEGKAPDELRRIRWEEVSFDSLNQEQLKSLEEPFEKFFLLHTRDEIYQEAQKRDVILSPGNSVKEVLEDPQLASRDFWVNIDCPELSSKLVHSRLPFLSNTWQEEPPQKPPSVGEHNTEVYGDELQIPEPELIRLKKEGIV